jgi:hypothetical protein
MARTHPDLDLITDAHIGSNGSEGVGGSDGGVDSPELVSAVARGSGSPELGVPAAPVGQTSRLRVGEHRCGTGNYSRVNRSGQGDFSDGTTTKGGGSPVCTRPGRYRLPKATRSGANGPGKEGKAHQGLVVA